jgi:hypothetical protein
MKLLCTTVIIFLAASFGALAQTNSVTTEDLKVLEGGRWSGSLTYQDYRSGKSTQIKSDVIINRKPGDANAWIFTYEYPDEPKANSSSEVAITEGGKGFNGGAIVETRRNAKDGTLTIVTTKPGTDNDRRALFRYSYLIAHGTFSIKKEVQLDGSTEWFTRNEYAWSRPGH